jgi:hypothetical protein
MSLPAWTADQVHAMAPDPASAKAGQGLAGPRKCVTLGRDARALWGECQGSGSRPYQVIVDAAEPAFRWARLVREQKRDVSAWAAEQGIATQRSSA